MSTVDTFVKKHSRKDWTVKEVALLRQMFSDGKGYEVIAEKLERSLTSCKSYGWRLGLRWPERKKLNEKIDLALRLVRSGHSTRKAAKIAGVSRFALRKRMEKANIPAAGRSRSRVVKNMANALKKRWELSVARCEEQGWPTGCSARQARILEAIETFDRPVKVLEITACAGLARAREDVYQTLAELLGFGWVQQRIAKGKGSPREYSLSPSVVAARASWRATRDAQAREAVPAPMENVIVPESRSQDMFDITGHRGDGNAGMRIIKRKKQ